MQPVSNFGPREDQPIEQEGWSLVQEFLPEGVPDAHVLLYDGEAKSTFTPTSEQLATCLVRYTALLHSIDAVDTTWILSGGVMSASELTLAYLIRGQAAGQKIPPDIVSALHAIARRLIAHLGEVMGGYFRNYDGLRRLVAIKDTLEALDHDLA